MSDAQATKLYVPGFAGLHQSLAPYGYVVIRFGAGLILLPHGYAKLFGGAAPFVAERVIAVIGFPAPFVWTYFLGLLEFFGGIMLALGLFTRAIALMLTVEMLFVTGWHYSNGYAFSAPRGGYEYPLLMLVVYFGILLRGSDRCAIDRVIGREF